MMFELEENLFEATASDMRRKQRSIKRLFPDFDDKTRKVENRGGIRLSNQNAETWRFKLHSGTGDHWYDGYLHFKDVLATLGELIRDKRLWVADKSRVDLKKLAKAFMDKVGIQLLCSCPADLYWGSHYIRSLGKYDAKYTKKELRSPRIRNPKQYGAVCKHLDRLLKALPFYVPTCSTWLKNFYGKDIARFEKEVKKEYRWLEPVKRELLRRKEEAPETEEVRVAKESKVNGIVKPSLKESLREYKERKIDYFIKDFLYKWQEEGSLPVGIIDAIEKYWKPWPRYWVQTKLSFLRNLKKRIPDFTDEIEEFEEEVESWRGRAFPGY